jgi:hypothetical protein
MITMLWGFPVDIDFTCPSMILELQNELTLYWQSNKKACQEKSLGTPGTIANRCDAS